MPESVIEPMHELRIWLRESDYRTLKAKSEVDGESQSEIVRRAVSQYLGEDAAGQSAPWLADMLDAVLSRYFQGFPEVLNRLVVSTFEVQGWGHAEFLKLLEATGDKDPKSQDERAAKLVENIQTFARQQADEFFQTLAEPEELIEPDEPTE